MNDPNGPIVVDGITHLYFQYRSTLHSEEPVVWAHVTSPDLVRWEYHRPAISPDPLGGDRDGCFSGNTVLDEAGQVRAFYSGSIEGEPLERTLLAVSTDGGYSFGPPREIVGPPPADEGIAVLRDPFVWRTTQGWRMVVGAGTSTQTAMMRLYESSDLDTWTYRGRLAQMSRTQTGSSDSGAMWECPQTFSVAGADVAIVGAWSLPDGISKVLSLVTSEVNDTTPPSPRLVDDGPNFYAASVMRDSPVGTIMWGWATEGRSPRACQPGGWSGMLTLPRVVGLSPSGRVTSVPLPQMASLREGPGRDLVSGCIDGLGAQLELAIGSPAEPDEPLVTRLRFGDVEYLDLSVDYVNGQVSIDRSHANADARAGAPSDVGQVLIAGLDELRTSTEPIRAFVDGSILELFLPGGRVATTRFYPTEPPPWRIEVDRAGDSARIRVWELSP